MSFGLGYFENGTWVDHSVPEGVAAPSPDPSASNGVTMEVVHGWYRCCADSTAAQPSASGNLGLTG